MSWSASAFVRTEFYDLGGLMNSDENAGAA